MNNFNVSSGDSGYSRVEYNKPNQPTPEEAPLMEETQTTETAVETPETFVAQQFNDSPELLKSAQANIEKIKAKFEDKTSVKDKLVILAISIFYPIYLCCKGETEPVRKEKLMNKLFSALINNVVPDYIKNCENMVNHYSRAFNAGMDNFQADRNYYQKYNINVDEFFDSLVEYSKHVIEKDDETSFKMIELARAKMKEVVARSECFRMVTTMHNEMEDARRNGNGNKASIIYQNQNEYIRYMNNENCDRINFKEMLKNLTIQLGDPNMSNIIQAGRETHERLTTIQATIAGLTKELELPSKIPNE